MSVELRLEAALLRIQSLQPLHAANIKLAQGGKLRLSPTSVALEAGVSRTLIGFAGCKYPKIREKILKDVASRAQLRKEAQESVESERKINLQASAKTHDDACRKIMEWNVSRGRAGDGAHRGRKNLAERLNEISLVRSPVPVSRIG